MRECYADLTPHIFAVETGLSSDPPMNWRVSWLDDYTLISSSDAHSPPKLAREATRFDTELSYDALFDALRSGDRDRYRGTIEFFPEEGKYHLDGHRKCGVCWEPVTTRAHGGRCSACGKPVTVGVYHRMEELADRPHGARPACAGPFASLIPLPEALGEMLGVGPGSKRVQREYLRLLERLGPELTILQELPLEEIAAAGDAVLAEGIRRMRAGEVRAQGGYDGEYGVIRLFDDDADRSAVVQLGMFSELAEEGAAAGAARDTGRHAGSSPPVAVEGTSTAHETAPDAERSTDPAGTGLERDLPFDTSAAADFGAEVPAPGPGPLVTDLRAEVNAPAPGLPASDFRAEVRAPPPGPSATDFGAEVRPAPWNQPIARVTLTPPEVGSRRTSTTGLRSRSRLRRSPTWLPNRASSASRQPRHLPAICPHGWRRSTRHSGRRQPIPTGQWLSSPDPAPARPAP